jgi:hypothetical protein
MCKTKIPTTFRRLDLSPSAGGWGRTKTDPVSETLWDFLSSTYKTMDKVQNKPNSSVQHKPSSESFQVYLVMLLILIFITLDRRRRRIPSKNSHKFTSFIFFKNIILIFFLQKFEFCHPSENILSNFIYYYSMLQYIV